MLLASLTSSLFSAFLAMLGKQWLNRYASVDMRGSAIERSQNRQRKLDGIVTWYFDHVMEALPLMLQIALLLLGCALSRYLWEINTTIASVVIGVTSVGVLFYLFIVVAGAAFVSCPYQTPSARILRSIPDIISLIPDTFHYIPHIPGILHSILSTLIEQSWSYSVIMFWGEESTHSQTNIVNTLLSILLLPILLILDTIHLLVTLPQRLHLSLQQGSEHQAAVLNLRCILWTLQTSLDGPVRLLTLNYLTTTKLTYFDPTLVGVCLNILIGCTSTSHMGVVITPGSEQLAKVSALCCLHTLSHLVAMDPIPRTLEHVRQQYARTFPIRANNCPIPFFHTLGAIHCILYSTHFEPENILHHKQKVTSWRYHDQLSSHSSRSPSLSRPSSPGWQNWWDGYRPSSDEYVIVAHALAKVAKFEYQRNGCRKVPRWLLCFALRSLSQSPLPPTSVVINCLSIIALDLCPEPLYITISAGGTSRGRPSITQKLNTMATSTSPGEIYSKHKAISALFPYAVWLEQHGEQEMVDAIFGVVRASTAGSFMWWRVNPFITTLFDMQGPPSLNRVIALISPYVVWEGTSHKKRKVTRWAAAVSTLPYTELVGQNVVNALLQIASVRSLRPLIPISVWTWCTHGDYIRLRPSLDTPGQSLSLFPGPSCILPGFPESMQSSSLSVTSACPDIGVVHPNHDVTIYPPGIYAPVPPFGIIEATQLSLPPGCLGRLMGNRGGVVCHVRKLGDIGILKSYFLLIWSEWDYIDDQSGGLAEMQISIQEDFSGVSMQLHREDLIKRLDEVLGQLDQGIVSLEQHKPGIYEDDIQLAKEQYGELKRVLVEVDREALNILTRKSPCSIIFSLLISGGMGRIPLNLYVCSASPMPIISHLGNLALLPIVCFVHAPILIIM